MNLQALDHFQKRPSPAGCFPEYPKGTGMCLKEIAWDGLRDGLVGQKKKKCVQCLSGPWASQRIWHVNNVLHRGKLQQEGFQPLSINTSRWAESRKNTPNVYFENETWSAHSQFCTCFSVDTKGSIFAILWLQWACHKYIFAWSSALPRLLDSKTEEQKCTQRFYKWVGNPSPNYWFSSTIVLRYLLHLSTL